MGEQWPTVQWRGGTLSLETWTVATCNLALFGLVLLLAGHASGVLADALDGLGTLSGLATFAYLWLLLIVATRWALATGGLRVLDDGRLGSLLLRGAVAGSLVGMAFLVGVVVAAGVAVALRGGAPDLSLALLVLIGAAVAAVVGAVVGLVATLVNAGLYRIADAVVPAVQKAETDD